VKKMSDTEITYIGETERRFIFEIKHDGELIGYGGMLKATDAGRKLLMQSSSNALRTAEKELVTSLRK